MLTLLIQVIVVLLAIAILYKVAILLRLGSPIPEIVALFAALIGLIYLFGEGIIPHGL